MSVPTLPNTRIPNHKALVGPGGPDGQAAERFGVSQLRALQNVRRLVERNRRLGESVPAAAGTNLVGIVGAGQMGASIAAAHVKNLLPVVLVDRCEEVLAAARQAILAELGDDIVAGRRVERPLSSRLLHCTVCKERLSECGLVLESIVENATAKQRLYQRLEPHLAPNAIWGSNTSAIPIARLAERLADPGRFCGLHFFHPVGARPLVEIIRGPATTAATIAAAVAHTRALGRMSIVVSDGPGFVMNRILMVYLATALALLVAGVEITHIERAMVEFGMALGPLEMLDEIGLDTALRSGRTLAGVVGEWHPGMEILVHLVKRGQLGRKAGAGFFRYPGKSVNPAVLRLVAECGPTSRKEARSRPRQWITRRLLGPMVWEAMRLLAEGKVDDPRDIDLGVIFGLGFPTFRGGLLWWVDHCGAEERLEFLQGMRPLGLPQGAAMPLAEWARMQTPFY